MENYFKKTIVLLKDISGRTAAELSQIANKYPHNNIFLHRNKEEERRVSFKSLIGILSLGLKQKEVADIIIENTNGMGSTIYSHLVSVFSDK